MAKQCEKILKLRSNVAPEFGHGKRQEKLAPLRLSFRDSSRIFPVETLVGAGAPTYVALINTFQRLYNQGKQATVNLQFNFPAPYSGACYGRYRAYIVLAT